MVKTVKIIIKEMNLNIGIDSLAQNFSNPITFIYYEYFPRESPSSGVFNIYMFSLVLPFHSRVPYLLADSNGVKTWVSNYKHSFLGDVVTHSCHNSNEICHNHLIACSWQRNRGYLNMKMSYPYRNSHYKDKTILSVKWKSPYLERWSLYRNRIQGLFQYKYVVLSVKGTPC